MKLLPLVWFYLVAHVACTSILVVTDEGPTTSTFDQLWQSLEDRGYNVQVSAPQDAVMQLQQEVDRFQHVVVFAQSGKALPVELSPQALTRRLDTGINLVLVASPDATELWRDFAREFEVDHADRAQRVVDHFGFDHGRDDGAHTLLSLSLADVPTPFVSAETRSGPPVLYRGTGHGVGRHPLLTPILRAGPTAFFADVTSGTAAEQPRAAGSGIALVSAFQAWNNARVLFVGSIELFSDELLRLPDTGNLAFALDLFTWVTQETGQLRIADLSYRAAGKDRTEPSYRVGTDLEIELALSADLPFDADDVQFEFGMLDPHVRMDFKRAPLLSGEELSNITSLRATFAIPDRHGVFSLRVDHRRAGWSRVQETRVIPVTPPRHDEYERFIAGALPYYGGAATVSILFVAFVALWVLQS